MDRQKYKENINDLIQDLQKLKAILPDHQRFISSILTKISYSNDYNKPWELGTEALICISNINSHKNISSTMDIKHIILDLQTILEYIK